MKSSRTSLFVTGTDTGIGKTLTCALLMRALKVQGIDAGYWKPVQTGMDSDLQTVREMAQLSSDEIAPNAYHFRLPASPNIAAQDEGRSIRLTELSTAFAALTPRHWVIEGAGGILVPLTTTETTRDWIQELRIPVLVVASSRLGTINHTLLTLEALQSREIPVSGIVINDVSEPADPQVIETLKHYLSVPILAEIPSSPANPPHYAWVNSWGPELFTKELLLKIFDPQSVPHAG